MNSILIGLRTKRVFIFFVFMFAWLLMTGCDGYISDAVWTQDDSVTIHSSNFEVCLSAALSDLPTIKIDRTLSQPDDMVLSVLLEKPIPSMGVYVRHLQGNTVQVSFIGKGTHEPDEYRAVITPLLSTITNSIRKTCSKDQ